MRILSEPKNSSIGQMSKKVRNMIESYMQTATPEEELLMSKDFENMLKSSFQISSSTEQLLLRERLKHTIDYYFQRIPCVPIEERLLLEALLNIVSTSQKELGDY